MTLSSLDASAAVRTLAACFVFGLLPLAADGSPSDDGSPDRSPAARELGAVQASSSAGSRSPITIRRTLGLAFLAGGAALTARGFDYKDEADAFYDAYRAAAAEAEIQKLYQRTTNRDVKSQVSWALAAACGITGLRLLFTGGGELQSTSLPGRSSLALVHAPELRGVGLRLQRRFH